jgi:hypothetical protein
LSISHVILLYNNKIMGNPQSKCEGDHGAGNCEKNGALWYPKCRPGFHAVGCCVCSPNCPDGFHDDGAFCGKPTYFRNIGTVPDCSPAQVKDAGLCYEPCRDGYSGVGPVCYANCPAGWKDTGVACIKDSYGNGAGLPLNECGEKEMDAGLCYNKCKDGYKGVSAVCWKTCPNGWRDTGIACQKDSYGNGAGSTLNYCGDKEMDAGLCYNKCSDGYKGAGPVCWATCPDGWKDIGAACEKDKYNNGDGHVPIICSNNQELVDGQCYDKCKVGFIRQGTKCIATCPEGFTDVGGNKCQKQQDIDSKLSCNTGQQMINGICHDECPTNYVSDGTGTTCIANCPNNWKLVDGKCMKDIKDNNNGRQIANKCPTDYEMRNNKCYPKCAGDYPYSKNEFCYRYENVLPIPASLQKYFV